MAQDEDSVTQGKLWSLNALAFIRLGSCRVTARHKRCKVARIATPEVFELKTAFTAQEHPSPREATRQLSNRKRQRAKTARPAGKSREEGRNERHQSSSLAGGGPQGETIFCARVKGENVRPARRIFHVVQY
jgi:hypothetical protein